MMSLAWLSLSVLAAPPRARAPINALGAVSTFAGNGVENSSNGPADQSSVSEPISMFLVHTATGTTRLFFTEYGGQRVENTTRCDIGGYSCSNTSIAAPGCLSAPGRNFDHPINSCDCGCDTFFMMKSGHRVRVVEDGIVRTIAGSGIRGYKDGPAEGAEFNHPYDVVADSEGNLLIADSHNHVIRKFDVKTNTVSTIIGMGKVGWRDAAKGTDAGINYPTGLAIHPDTKTLYIADRSNNCIRSVADEGAGAVTTIAGNCENGHWGHKDGDADTALFSGPTSIAIVNDSSFGTILYVTDIANNAVRAIVLQGDSKRVVTVEADKTAGPFEQPTGIAFDKNSQTLYVTSYIGGRVVAFRGLSGTRAVLREVAAGNGDYGFQDGPAMIASFKGPKGLAIDSVSKTLFVADFFNSRIRSVGLPEAVQQSATLRSYSVPTPPRPFKQVAKITSVVDALKASNTTLRVMLWTGHSGPFHDHFHNGKVLADALNATEGMLVTLPCRKDETIPCESVFADSHLGEKYDVILIYADTYENPLRGSLTDAQWDGMFAFVQGGGGFFALHTASACWDNKVEHPDDKWSDKFHIELLNCEFGGHSPYKDYVAKIIDPTDVITEGMTDYVVSDELYHPIVYNTSRSKIFITAYDQGENSTAIHGLRHTYGEGRVLYFAQGHDMAEFENAGEFPNGNHAFQHVILKCLMWLAKRI